MSTRSRIGIVREASTARVVVESIYCHFDGYPEGVGQTLLDHWTDEKKINRLIKLDNLSSLGSVIGRKHNFDTHLPDYWSVRDQYEHLPEEEQIAFRQKLEAESAHGKGWCCAYGRDRGETDCAAIIHGIDRFPDWGQEAEYVFDPQAGTWRVRPQNLNPAGWNTVTSWSGWATIPEAIAAREVAEREERDSQSAEKGVTA